MSKHSIRSGSASSPSAVLQPVERLDALLAAALGAQLLLVEREPRVALGQLEDAALVAALGGAQLDRTAAALARAPRRPSGSAPTSRCTTTSGGIVIALAVVLEHERLGDRRQVVRRLVLEVEALAVGQDAVAHLEDLRVGVRPVDRDRDRVERADRRRWRRAGARAASGSRAGGCARARRPRSAARAAACFIAPSIAARSRGSGRRGSRSRRRSPRGTPPARRSRRRAPRSA